MSDTVTPADRTAGWTLTHDGDDLIVDCATHGEIGRVLASRHHGDDEYGRAAALYDAHMATHPPAPSPAEQAGIDAARRAVDIRAAADTTARVVSRALTEGTEDPMAAMAVVVAAAAAIAARAEHPIRRPAVQRKRLRSGGGMTLVSDAELAELIDALDAAGVHGWWS